MASIASIKTAACTSGIGKVNSRIVLLRLIAILMAARTVSSGSFIAMENSGYVLLESGDKIELE